MTGIEFEREFDVLYNNITSNQAPELNAYEKSVFLTNAQNQFVRQVFLPTTDQLKGGYDGSQERQYDLSSITKVTSVAPTIISASERTSFLSLDSIIYRCPEDAFLIINEEVRSMNNEQYQVIPLHYDEYRRLSQKPYKYPVKNSAWRLFTKYEGVTYAEIIGRFKGEQVHYICRYVPTLIPIITSNLEDLMTGLTIDGYSQATECMLPEECHREILDIAVIKAKQAWLAQTALMDNQNRVRNE
jgi:hypothetical protein